MQRKFIAVALVLSLVACTEPGEKTGIGAATGGAIGAGLGAIVGSQTGSAGGGLAIGALAGAATGSLISNAFEAQDKTIRMQDEALERQEQRLAAQQNEIQELRRMQPDGAPPSRHGGISRLGASSPRGVANSGDRIRLRPPAKYASASSRGASGPSATSRPIARAEVRTPITPAIPPTPERETSVAERDITATAGRAQLNSKMGGLSSDYDASLVRARSIDAAATAATIAGADVHADITSPVSESGVEIVGDVKGDRDVSASIEPKVVGALSREDPRSPECRQAREEAGAAARATESADKLYHYRRALRLCPDEGEFHLGLGEVYLRMKRASDAEFELKEALRLDPSSSRAEDLLRQAKQY